MGRRKLTLLFYSPCPQYCTFNVDSDSDLFGCKAVGYLANVDAFILKVEGLLEEQGFSLDLYSTGEGVIEPRWRADTR